MNWSFGSRLFLLTLSLLGFIDGHRAVNKYYEVKEIPIMRWSGGNTAYKHEMVKSGGLERDVIKGSNYSVYPLENCNNKRIAFVLQLQPTKPIDNVEELQRRMCTVSVTIDDGHVEVWYGLCLTNEASTKRKFDFALNPTQYMHFNFEKLTIKVYRRDGDWGQDFEMGKIEHIDHDREFLAFDKFMIFLYHGSCEKVNLKQVFAEDDWRQSGELEQQESVPLGGTLLPSILATWMACLAAFCLIMSTMNAWALGVYMPTNRFYDAIYKPMAKKTTGTGVEKTGEKEEKSCETAEDRSEDRPTVDLFGDGTANRAPNEYLDRYGKEYGLRD